MDRILIEQLTDDELIQRVTIEFLGWQRVDAAKVDIQVGRSGPDEAVYWRIAGDDFIEVRAWNPVTSMDDALRLLTFVDRRVVMEKHGPTTIYNPRKDWEWRCGIATSALAERFVYGYDTVSLSRAICRAVLAVMGSRSRL